MNDKWFTTHKNWYEGVGNRLESQNNGLEAFNNVIKKEETIRECLPLGRFLNLCLETCERWSKWYKHGDKVFIEKPSIAESQWSEGYKWCKSNKAVTSAKLETTT